MPPVSSILPRPSMLAKNAGLTRDAGHPRRELVRTDSLTTHRMVLPKDMSTSATADKRTTLSRASVARQQLIPRKPHLLRGMSTHAEFTTSERYGCGSCDVPIHSSPVRRARKEVEPAIRSRDRRGRTPCRAVEGIGGHLCEDPVQEGNLEGLSVRKGGVINIRDKALQVSEMEHRLVSFAFASLMRPSRWKAALTRWSE